MVDPNRSQAALKAAEDQKSEVAEKMKSKTSSEKAAIASAATSNLAAAQVAHNSIHPRADITDT